MHALVSACATMFDCVRVCVCEFDPCVERTRRQEICTETPSRESVPVIVIFIASAEIQSAKSAVVPGHGKNNKEVLAVSLATSPVDQTFI